jgi:hypothetical protein
LKNLSGCHIFWKLFDAYCQQVRGMMFIPITCFNRAHDEATDEMELQEDYPNLDVQLMDLVALLGEDWEIDNALLLGLLCPLLLDGTDWAFIKTFEATKNGRDAIQTLKMQAEGAASDTSCKAIAHALVDKLEYTGKSRNFTYTSYVEKLQWCFSELDIAGAPVDGTRQVHHLLREWYQVR